MSGPLLDLRQLYLALDQGLNLAEESPREPSSCTSKPADPPSKPRSYHKLPPPPTPAETSAPVSPSAVGIVWDTRMLLHKSENAPHVERPERMSQILAHLRQNGQMERVRVLAPKAASFEDLRRVHTKAYLRKLMRRAGPDTSAAAVGSFAADEFEDVFLNEHSLLAAVLAAGSSIEAVEAVVKKEVRSAFAVVRPPGHHAEAHCAMGFCVFNNVAVAAAFALEKLGVERVLIVDWDVHHGNGTQRVFVEDNRVCYFSVHRFDKGRFFPGNDSASAGFTGKDGTSVNVCWEGKGYGDEDYLAAWDHVLLPIARTFDPQLILVSAGFDAAVGDPIGQCQVTPQGYRMLTRKLQGIGQGEIVMVLEGGYNLESLGDCVQECVAQLMESNDRSPLQQPVAEKPLPLRTINAINKTIAAHQKFWPQLKLYPE